VAEHIIKLLEGIFQRESGLRRAVSESSAAMLWKEAAGKEAEGKAEALRVRDGVLWVVASSAVWAQELSLRKREILRRINSRLGAGDVLKDIRFKTGSVQGE